MTYKELLAKLNNLTEDELDLDVAVEIQEEVFLIDRLGKHFDNTLDEDMPVLRAF